ncbi:MAG: polyketide synthase [Gemmataceae bacterium]
MARHCRELLQESGQRERSVTIRELPDQTEAIAVIGLGCRLPGNVSDPQSFWTLLRKGSDAVGLVPAQRWRAEDVPPNCSWGGFLNRIEDFDPHFFRISPREADWIDPQQRLLLETAWEALEDAAIPPDLLAGTATGCFVGISGHDYEVLQRRQATGRQLGPHFATGNSNAVAAGRLAYVLGLHGPTLAVDTACSSSLVAVHLACQSLLNGECQVALASGVNLLLDRDLGLVYAEAGMLSADGRCKTFDAAANGYVRGEGCATLVLKRLGDALRDGDRIQAVIRGSAIN